MSDTQKQERRIYLMIRGMTCASCEILLEKKWSKLPGVIRVQVIAKKGKALVVTDGTGYSPAELQKALESTQYQVSYATKGTLNAARERTQPRPTFFALVGYFSVAAIIFWIFSRTGAFTTPSVGSGLTLGTAFLIGLVASISSCAATVGGLLISTIGEFHDSARASRWQRGVPVLIFIGGRLLSYAFFGGVLGVLGKALSPSPIVTGLIVGAAAVYMIVAGLDMLGITPRWLKAILPQLPTSFARGMMRFGERSKFFSPFIVGVATFFVPCGFTQALQLYALTLHNPALSAALLFVFALGTSPMLMVIGWTMQSVRGSIRALFFHGAGALIFIMGIANVSNAFTIAGYPLSFNFLKSSTASETIQPLPPLEAGIQVVRMAVGYAGYSPNQFSVRVGVPVKWIIDGSQGGGCAMAFQAPQLGIRQILSRGENVIEFTAPNPGTYQFSCSMGMYRGSITAVPNT